MARLSLIGVAACAMACGTLLSGSTGDDVPGSGGDDGGAEGSTFDAGTTVGPDDDASTVDLSTDASAFDGGVCPPGAPWTVKGSFAMPENDIRSVRRVGDTYYYAYDFGNPNGIDLGAAPVKLNGTGGASIGWFASINAAEGQTFPAVTSDALTLVYQQNLNGASGLVLSKRSTPTQPWPSASPITYNNATIGEANEPYVTPSGILWFTNPDGLVKEATLNGTLQVDIVKQHVELAPARFPVVTDDGLEIIFTRNEAKQNVYSATRASATAPFGAPALVATLNQIDRNTRVAWISKDACTLYFVRSDSTRPDDPFKFFIALR